MGPLTSSRLTIALGYLFAVVSTVVNVSLATITVVTSEAVQGLHAAAFGVVIAFLVRCQRLLLCGSVLTAPRRA